MKKNQVKKSIAKSWQKGGAHRIAYEQRMQEKKTAPVVNRNAADEFRALMDHPTSPPAEKVIGNPKAEMACEYYRSACLLLLMERPELRKSAEHLIAEADAILGAEAW